MKKDQNNADNLIVRYLNSEINHDERKELLNWINQSDQNKSEFIALKDIWDSSNKISDCSEEQLSLFYKTEYQKSRKSKIVVMRRLIAIAAVLVVALVTTILIPQIKHKSIDGLQVFTVPMGSRSKVILVDGTEVNINSGSELSCSNSFSSQNRSVTLTGEAFFKVKADSKHPFIVKTKNYNIKVVGTQFNVCTYSEDIISTATLAEGKIELIINDSNRVIEVKPGEKFSFDNNSQKYSLADADVEQEIAWKNGEFIFKTIKFPDLTKRLERWYDVKLICSAKQLASYSYSGRFKNQETIWQVLDAIKLTSPIDYKIKSFREFEIIYKPKN